MHQKDLIRNAWKAAGLYDEKDSRLMQFLKLLDEPAQCWPGMIDACRRNYAAYKAKVVQPILGTADKLVHLSLIRAALPTSDDEIELLQSYVTSSDPVRDEIELKAIALKNVPALNEALRKKANLTPEVRAVVARRAT